MSKANHASEPATPNSHYDRGQAERAEAHLAAIVESSEDAIIGKNLEGIITSWNAAAEHIFGYRPEQAVGRSILMLVPKERWEEEPAILAKLVRGERVEHFETVRITKDGHRKHVSLTISPIKDKSGNVIGASKIARDITERKLAEAAMREVEAAARKQAQMLDLAPILMRDLEDRIIYWNRGAEAMYGWTSQEALGRISHELMRTQLPEPLEEMRARLRAGKEWQGELQHCRKDGSMVISASRWLPYSAAGSPGNLEAVIEVNTDVTKLKRAEEELMLANTRLSGYSEQLEATVAERTLKLRESIEELESFSYSLSHDMRAPLRAMRNYTQVVVQEVGDRLGAEHTGYLKKVISSAERLDRLITDVLALSRVSRAELRLMPVDVEKLLAEIPHERPELQPPRAVIRVEHPLLPMLGDEASLTQCITNLLGNAVKFVLPGVVPEVRVRSEALGGDVRLWFEDNGIGIPSEAQARLFGMFERVHSEPGYEGTGIGLAIVRKAVERMNGQAGLQSEPGKGSQFWVQLPGVEKK
jgi:PAS domain S-box-containing protein